VTAKPSNPLAVRNSVVAADALCVPFALGGHAWLDLFLFYTGTDPTTPLKVKGWGLKRYPPVGDKTRYHPAEAPTPFPSAVDRHLYSYLPLDNPATGASELTFPTGATAAYQEQDLTGLTSNYPEIGGLLLAANPTLVAFKNTTRLSYHVGGFEEGLITVSQAVAGPTAAIIVGQLVS